MDSAVLVWGLGARVVCDYMANSAWLQVAEYAQTAGCDGDKFLPQPDGGRDRKKA